ncbi:MAG: IS1 family transposase [Bacteroidales bacterium]|nr:MAG: IS1 family transposase [Bacteroidales bacterium]
MRQCPKCKSEELCKDGIAKHKERFRCKGCNFRFTVEHIGKPELLKRTALILYLEGLGFRSIGRYLKISHVAVYNWIKEYGERLDELRSSEGIEVVEMDEMHTYVSSKKICWIWIAVDRHGQRFVNCVIGARSTRVGEKLWKKIRGKAVGIVATDYRQPYETFIPKEKHVPTKAGTYAAEGYNSLFRHFLARLRRETKCYTKSHKMLLYSVLLLMSKWNKDIAILN